MDVLSIVLGTSGALGSLGTVSYWLFTRRLGLRKVNHEEIDARVNAALGPIHTDISGLHGKIDHLVEHTHAVLKNEIRDALDPIKEHVTALSTKIEPLWHALVSGALNSAEILHHPHPERREIDELLDHFRDNVLTRDEEFRLRRFLVQIKNWEQGQDLGFPVYEREPAAAGNLLAMLDLVKIYREQQRV